ncbi:response regulator transcription factor [Sphingobacterium sp.]|uniref:response regulator transcription factor n=1 Tax=Sphingobacterium sp. TaxID=341027 RepID=UPI0028989253|nr:response regulator transcription factor [Sphingobacterium sp.]
MINVLLVDDHQVVRSGLRMMLETNDKLSVVEELGSAEEALIYLENHDRPDLILTDLNMTEMDGIMLVKILKNLYPEIKIAILSMIEDNIKVAEAFRVGADGYLSKATDYKELEFGVFQIANGKAYLTTSIGLNFVKSYKVDVTVDIHKGSMQQIYEISDRELAVLELIAEGFTNAEIADKIFLSKRTVEGLRQHLIEKTNSKNTAELVRFAFQNYLLQ